MGIIILEWHRKHNILGARTPNGIVQDSYPIHLQWNFNSGLSKFLDLFIFTDNNGEAILDRDYMIDNEFLFDYPVSKNLVIDGKGHTIKGNGEKLLSLNVYGKITFKNLNFEGLNELFSIYDNGCCNFINCTFSSNKGVISVYGSGVCNAVNSKFISNHATTNGGAIYSENEVNIRNCLFDSNSADYSGNDNKGGAIYSKVLSLDKSTFVNNHANGYGGAFFTSKLTPINSTFNENSATFGGAIYIANSDEVDLKIQDNDFYRNVASNKGGAVYINDSDMHLKFYSNNIIIDGPAYCVGFAVYNCGEYDTILYNYWGEDFVDFLNEPILVKKGSIRDVYLLDPDMRFNPDETVHTLPLSLLQNEIDSRETLVLTCDYAYKEGYDDLGGIIVTRDNIVIDGQGHILDGMATARIFDIQAKNVTLRNIVFANGYSDYGGAIRGDGLLIDNCSFINNYANYGGAVSGAGIIINESSFNGNRAFNGGAVYLSGDGEVYESNFTGNHALDYGGAIYSDGNLTLSYYVVFKDNIADDDSNDYYLGENASVIHLNDNFKSFTQLQQFLDASEGPVVKLTYDYRCELSDCIWDNKHSGINITRDNIVIDGQGHTIDGNRLTRIFFVISDNVTFKNINFVNGGTENFSDDRIWGGAIESQNFAFVTNCTFLNNIAVSGAVCFNNGGLVESSKFINNTGNIHAASIMSYNDIYLDNVSFEGSRVIVYESSNEDYYAYGKIFNVTRIDPDLKISIKDISQGFPLFVEIESSANYSGDVILEIGGVDYTVNLKDGLGNITIEALKVGVYTATVSSIPSIHFRDCVRSTDFEVHLKPLPDLSISIEDVYEGTSLFVEIFANEDLSDDVTLEIDGVDYTVAIVNGYGNITIDGLNPGTYIATVILEYNDVFEDSRESVEFNIYQKVSPNLVIDVQNSTFGENVLIEIHVNDIFTGLIPISIANENDSDEIIAMNYAVVVGGYGSVAISALDVGKYIATAEFKPIGVFIGETAFALFEVYPKNSANLSNPSASSVRINPNLKIVVSSIRVGKKAIIKITSNKSFSGRVKVIIRSKTYIVNVVKGKGTRAIKGLNVGTYKATAKLAATKTFKASTKTTSFKVKSHVIKLSLKKVKIKRSSKKLKITAALRIDGKLAKGKKLKFLFKGKRYFAKTNRKGIAIITIKKKVLKKLRVGKKIRYQVQYGKKRVRRTVKVLR